MMTKWLATVAVALLPGAAVAHPGPHEGSATGLFHAATQPDHLLALLAIGAAMMWVPRICRHVREWAIRRHVAAAPVPSRHES